MTKTAVGAAVLFALLFVIGHKKEEKSKVIPPVINSTGNNHEE